jgi:hypothetical protein
VQQIERFFLPIFWEYNPQKNAVASLFLFDEFSYPSQKTTEKGKNRKKKKANAPDTKVFLEEINGKNSPHYEEMFSEIIIFRLHRRKKKKKSGGWFSIISPKY